MSLDGERLSELLPTGRFGKVLQQGCGLIFFSSADRLVLIGSMQPQMRYVFTRHHGSSVARIGFVGNRWMKDHQTLGEPGRRSVSAFAARGLSGLPRGESSIFLDDVVATGNKLQLPDGCLSYLCNRITFIDRAAAFSVQNSHLMHGCWQSAFKLRIVGIIGTDSAGELPPVREPTGRQPTAYRRPRQKKIRS